MTSPGLAPRLRGRVATRRSQQIAGLTIVAVIGALAAGGMAFGVPAVAIFAVGAGAGYALSGSV